jgi:hypothetical protein
MKKLEKSLLDEVITQAGLSKDKAQEIIGTIRISLVRQAAKDPGKKITLDSKSLKELEESIRIGAKITSDEANKVLGIMKVKVRELNDPQIQLFEDGTFDVNEEDVDFKVSE